ncbi:hypothetical protein BP5796_01512 [Coleophoma crateriformis]|uniref:Uncharacterized protein n=1 Tax=Coleophoma crateriformis TaxID=565419 RepID=A0A3D8T296_9HELO|nr:hypothetical protein BP5796_01512 [Coleophoma crateriformis]
MQRKFNGLKAGISKSNREKGSRPHKIETPGSPKLALIFSSFGFATSAAESEDVSSASTYMISPSNKDAQQGSSILQSDRSSISSKRRGSFPWDLPCPTEQSLAAHRISPQIIDPPRPAKEGFEWVWFPEGYWAERESTEVTDRKKPWFGKRSSSYKSGLFSPKPSDYDTSLTQAIKVGGNGKVGRNRSGSHSRSDVSKGSPAFDCYGSTSAPALSTKPLIVLHEAEPRRSALIRGIQILSPSSGRSEEDKGDPQSLFSRTRSRLRGGLKSKREKSRKSEISHSSDDALPSRTTMLLEGTSVYFARAQSRKQKAGLAASPATSSPDSKGSRRRFGLAPWHRRNSQDTLMSVTTSLHNLLMGATPAVTPESMTENGRNARAVDLTDPGQDSFLTSEAQRINTPPLPQLTPTGHRRGFFIDMPTPEDDNDSEDADFTRPGPHPGLHVPSSGLHGIKRNRQSPSPAAREWFDASINTSARTCKSPARNGHFRASSPNNFQISIPEHLETSPMCPANPFHESGGAGICPYHGRRRIPTEERKLSMDSVDLLMRMT